MTIIRRLLVRKNAFFIQLHLNKWQTSHQILHMKDIFIRKNDKLYLFIIFFIKKQKEYRKAIKEKNQNRVA